MSFSKSKLNGPLSESLFVDKPETILHSQSQQPVISAVSKENKLSPLLDSLESGFHDLEPERIPIKLKLDLGSFDSHQTFFLHSFSKLSASAVVTQKVRVSKKPKVTPKRPSALQLIKNSPRPIPPSAQSYQRSFPLMYNKSILAPLSGHFPDSVRRPRLEDQRLLDLFKLQLSRDSTDFAFSQRFRKTIRKVKSFWSQSNVIYPFAFRKLVTRTRQVDKAGADLRTAQFKELKQVNRKQEFDDANNYYVITEDLSKKMVNPEGAYRTADSASSRDEGMTQGTSASREEEEIGSQEL